MARTFVDEHAVALPRELKDDAVLLVSELVTNAVRYGEPDIVVELRFDPPWLGVAVTDEGPRMPVVADREPAPGQTSGRGLWIVEALSSRWGVAKTDPPPGKTVWFELNKGDD